MYELTEVGRIKECWGGGGGIYMHMIEKRYPVCTSGVDTDSDRDTFATPRERKNIVNWRGWGLGEGGFPAIVSCLPDMALLGRLGFIGQLS
jgi:hypothetical protein